MNDPAQIDIIADRNVAYVEDYSFYPDINFTGSTLLMQVRTIKDTGGTPLIEAPTVDNGLTVSYAGTATVASHVTAGRLLDSGEDNIYAEVNPATGNLYQGTDNLTMSVITMGISLAALQGLPFPDERGEDWSGWYDIIRTPAVGVPEIIMRGRFVDRAGVTIP